MLSLLVLAAGLVLVVAGAELFFAGLLASASRLRVSAYALTVVVSGFELENLVAGIAADLRGFPNAAAGTFLGGTTFLALGVAGLAAAVAPIKHALPRAALAWAAAAPLPLLGLGLDGRLSRLDGGVLLAWFAIALIGIVRSGGVGAKEEPVSPRFAALRAVAGLALLSAGGEVLGEGIRRVVSHLGISETLLGNTAIAAGVEAEEVVRVAVPARRGRGDIALGNVLGTVAHFAAFNAGVIALVRPLDLDRVSRHLHLPAAAVSPILLALLAARGLSRRDGMLLLALYAGYVAGAIAAST